MQVYFYTKRTYQSKGSLEQLLCMLLLHGLVWTPDTGRLVNFDPNNIMYV